MKGMSYFPISMAILDTNKKDSDQAMYLAISVYGLHYL